MPEFNNFVGANVQYSFFTVGPTTVTILNKKDPVSAGKFVDVRCQTVGARPPPTITWWLAGKQVSVTKYYKETCKAK